MRFQHLDRIILSTAFTRGRAQGADIEAGFAEDGRRQRHCAGRTARRVVRNLRQQKQQLLPHRAESNLLAFAPANAAEREQRRRHHKQQFYSRLGHSAQINRIFRKIEGHSRARILRERVVATNI